MLNIGFSPDSNGISHGVYSSVSKMQDVRLMSILI